VIDARSIPAPSHLIPLDDTQNPKLATPLQEPRDANDVLLTAMSCNLATPK
jgi:hypothetical protein